MTDGRQALHRELARVGGRVVSEEETTFESASSGTVDIDLIVGEDGVDFSAPGAASSEGTSTRERLRFAGLPGNKLHELFGKLDGRLSPARGLRRLRQTGELEPVTARCTGKTLLFVHGTFSNTDTLLEHVALGDPELLRWAHAHYANVLTYDYPTLSQQAIASAMDLARLCRANVDGPIDVVSHSQGGLVTRYWLELLDRERLAVTRSIFVAGTLAGTSLAAPPALRSALGFLGDVGWVLAKGAEVASVGIPMFGAVAAIFGVLEKALGVLSKAPIPDAGVAIVPGFVGMSRVGTNAEIRALRDSLDAVPPGYFAVTGDFEPAAPGWKFWQRWKDRIANGLADKLFDGPNDLVVDTASQTSLSDTLRIEGARVLHYPRGVEHVHHTNYFDQKRSLDFIARSLGRL